VTSFNLAEHMYGHVYDPPTGPWGYGRVTNPERRPYPTKDGHVGILPYTDDQYERFFKAVGWSQTHAADPRFNSYGARAEHARELYALMGEISLTRTTDEWVELLKPLHIPVVHLRRLDDLPEDPHLKAVDFFQRFEHPQAGGYFSLRPPVRYSLTPANIRRHPPRLGEHTQEVLAEVFGRPRPDGSR
jgi:crotonobetainyl-CoA:carnitine CoA-transferase CaiB-like acyl-CoA transferase